MSDVTWKPFPKQEEFLKIPFDVFEAFFGGSAGPGKSEILVMLPLLYEFYKYKGFKGLIMRRTFPELESEIILRAHKYYPQTGAVWQDKYKRYHWPAFGSYIRFGHAQHEKDIRNYDGDEYQYFAPDEVTSFTEWMYRYLFSRMRSLVGIPPIIRSASNPGNIGHTWVRKRFVEPCKEGGKLIRDQRSGELRVFVPASVYDNPELMEKNPRYVKFLEMLPPAERAAKLLGDWWTFEGQVFQDWRREPLDGEPENAKHIIKPFPIPSFWPRILAIDWGYDALAYSLWGAVSPDGRLYVYREFGAEREKVAIWGSTVHDLNGGDALADIVMDSTAFEERGEEHTLVEQFRQASGLNPRKADKGAGSRISGKVLVQELLRWRQIPKSIPTDSYNDVKANTILRDEGMKAYAAYLDQFKVREEETNIPKLQVFDTCERLTEVVPNCVYDKDKDGNETEDVADFKGDDPYDTLRYLCRAYQRHIRESRTKFEDMASRAGAVRQLETTGDMTSFYRKMEVLDNSRLSRNRSIKRVRRLGRR